VLAKLALAKTTKTASNTEEQLHAPQATRATLGYIPLASGTCEATRRNAMCVLGLPLAVQFGHISFPKSIFPNSMLQKNPRTWRN